MTETPPATPLYSILRIKRKRTTSQLPLDALLINNTDDSSSASQPTSKRRRANPPLGSSAAGPVTPVAPSRGIFRFAETVPIDSFSTTIKTRQLKDRITAFLSHPPPSVTRSPSSRPLSRVSSSTSLNAPGTASPKEKKLAAFLTEGKRARYRVIEKQRNAAVKPGLGDGARGAARPPVVRAAADVEKEKNELKIYDAVAEEDEDGQGVKILATSDKDAEMTNNFASMLEEYLTLQDNLNPTRAPSPPPVPSVAAPAEEEEENDEDFVYDVYYRDLRPTATSVAGLPALAGGSGVGGGVDVASMAGLTRIGELAGLADDDELLQGEEGDSEEEEDEDDQDSNEENDYRNDYPDGEDQEESEGEDAAEAFRSTGGGAFDDYRDDSGEESDEAWSY